MEAGRKDIYLVSWSVCGVVGVGGKLVAGKPAVVIIIIITSNC